MSCTQREERPGADAHEEATVQDYLFRPNPVVREDTRTPPISSGSPASREGGANTCLAAHSAMQVDVIDLTADDDEAAPTSPEPAYVGDSHTAASLPLTNQPRPSNAVASSQSVMPNDSVPNATPDFVFNSSPHMSKQAQVPLLHTVTVSSDNSDLDEMEAAALDFLKQYVPRSRHFARLPNTCRLQVHDRLLGRSRNPRPRILARGNLLDHRAIGRLSWPPRLS